MLALGMDAFDQDLTGGWRPLSEDPGCEGRAADLIRTYREFYQARMRVLYWHEGQLRANVGQLDAAIRLMEQSRKPTDEDGWNLYVAATIAFLRNDREALIAARDALARWPDPGGFREQTLPNGYRVRWPPNSDIVQRLRQLPRATLSGAMAAPCRPITGANR